MPRNALAAASRMFVALLLLAGSAAAQEDEGWGSNILEQIADGLRRLGETTRGIGPETSPIGESEILDFSGKVRVFRPIDRSYQSSRNVHVHIDHKLGEVRVSTWSDPVVALRAEITAGAESYAIAQELANGIELDVDNSQDHLTIQTRMPNTASMGQIAVEVRCNITVPDTAAVSCSNTLGDIILQDIGGAVEVDSRFGRVDLRGAEGPAHVRSRGEWPVAVQGLARGGSFELLGSQAEFSDIGGELEIKSFLGSIAVSRILPDARVYVSSEGGDVTALLTPDALPDIETSVFFGEIAGNAPLDMFSIGSMKQAFLSGSASSSLVVDASFAAAHFTIEKDSSTPVLSAAPSGELVETGIERELQAPAEGRLEIEALAGDIEVVGTQEALIRVEARPAVRAPDPANAQQAVDGLDLALTTSEDGLVRIETTADAELLDNLGAESYRVDLLVRVPQAMPVRVEAAEGLVRARGLAGPIALHQNKGDISVTESSGELQATSMNGSVEVLEFEGPAIIKAEDGPVQTRNVAGLQDIVNAGGRTTVDAPGAGLKVRQTGADVRIISLDGIRGNYDVVAEQGNISILIPESADATIIAATRNGRVVPSFPLTGEIGEDYQELRGHTQPGVTGEYEVVLGALDGDIIID
jgi:hypothetical protein